MRAVLTLAFGAGVAVAALGPLGTVEGEAGPGRVEIQARATGQGRTVVELPPLGRITARTHRAPVAVTARVTSVDVEGVQSVAVGPQPLDRLRNDMEADVGNLLRRFAGRVALVAVGAGAVAGLLVPGRRWWDALVGAAGGILAVGGLLLSVWGPYDLTAFREPRFEGALERAPGILRSVQQNLGDLDQAVADRVAVLSGRLADLYAASADELPGGAAGETAILHVSDIHLNPLAVELVDRLARDFAVVAVLDTGDLTTFGVPFEGRIGDLVAQVGVPWYFVPGNHDSTAVRAQLAAVPNVVLLDGETVEIGGVRVLGVADPTFTASNEVSTEEANERKEASAPIVAALVARDEPDVLAVHDLRQAAASVGRVPLVVAGHVHARSEAVESGTRLLTVGSTGATGLGTYTVDTGERYEAEILRFFGGTLVAVDYLTFEGLGGAFTVDRQLFGPPAAVLRFDPSAPWRVFGSG